MMLESPQIQNFKGLKDITLSNLGVFNVFIGKNNSGKTSILHALNLISASMIYQNFEMFYEKRYISDLFNNKEPFSFNVTFQNFQ